MVDTRESPRKNISFAYASSTQADASPEGNDLARLSDLVGACSRSCHDGSLQAVLPDERRFDQRERRFAVVFGDPDARAVTDGDVVLGGLFDRLVAAAFLVSVLRGLPPSSARAPAESQRQIRSEARRGPGPSPDHRSRCWPGARSGRPPAAFRRATGSGKGGSRAGVPGGDQRPRRHMIRARAALRTAVSKPRTPCPGAADRPERRTPPVGRHGRRSAT